MVISLSFATPLEKKTNLIFATMFFFRRMEERGDPAATILEEKKNQG